jgi:hypothetical protein
MLIQFGFGSNVITSYRRLSYTPWHAIAEFVDNSTQSYMNNKVELDAIYNDTGDLLSVSVVYDRDSGFIRIADNSVGMSQEELSHALQVGVPPVNTSGRSKYGMGMKTAACWLGDEWTIRTKRLGETVERSVVVNVPTVAANNRDLPTEIKEGFGENEHYTVIEIHKLHRPFHGRTIGKIRDYLRSMYRVDLTEGTMKLEWNAAPLDWEGYEDKLLTARDGYRSEDGSASLTRVVGPKLGSRCYTLIELFEDGHSRGDRARCLANLKAVIIWLIKD